MDTLTTTAQTPSTTQADAKAKRLQLGKLPAPIHGVNVYAKQQDPTNFQGKTSVISWAVMTPEGKLIKATTYDGALGKDFKLGEHNTQTIPPTNPDGTPTKDIKKALKGYTPVGTDNFPAFVVPAES